MFFIVSILATIVEDPKILEASLIIDGFFIAAVFIAQAFGYAPAYFVDLIDPNSTGIFITPFAILIFVLPFMYYVLCEYFLEGRTLTKFLTKTKVEMQRLIKKKRNLVYINTL